MPVINTRKRKPTAVEVSALDRLATVSAHELSSQGSHGADAGYQPSRSAFPFNQDRCAANNEGSSSSQSGSEGDNTVSSAQKRRRLYASAEVELQMERMQGMLRRAEWTLQMQQSNPHSATKADDQWCSISVHEEILRLQATVEGIVGSGRLGGGTRGSQDGSQITPLQTLQNIHTAVRGLQSFFTQPKDMTALALCARPPLDTLWQQGRESAREDLRSKLSFWKHKALDVKERLRVSLEAAATAVARARTTPTAPASSSMSTATATHASPPAATATVVRLPQVDPALQAAFDFVSTFYLLDMVPETRQLSEDPMKDKCVAKASVVIADEFNRTEALRLRDIPIHIPQHPIQRQHHSIQPPLPSMAPNSSATYAVHHPPVGGQPAPSPLSTASSTTNIFENDEEGDDPSDEDEPLPMQSPNHANGYNIGSASRSVSNTTSSTTATPVQTRPSPVSATTAAAAAANNSNNNNKQKGLPLTTRRRLEVLLESQQAKALAQEKRTPPVTTHHPSPQPVATSARPGTQNPSQATTTSRHAIAATVMRTAPPPPAAAATGPSSSSSSHSTRISIQEYTAANQTNRPLPKTFSTNKSASKAVAVTTAAASATGAAPSSAPAAAPAAPSLALSRSTAENLMVYFAKKANASKKVPIPSSKPSSAPPAPNRSDAESDTTKHTSLSNGCTACGRNDSYSSLLLCDNECGREFHTFCLAPPLVKIPEGDWYCPKCREAEQIKPGQHIYLCSATQCDKITGAKYCAQHRCQFDKCPNRMHAGGCCRRHESHRPTKPVPRRDSSASEKASTSTSATATSATATTKATVASAAAAAAVGPTDVVRSSLDAAASKLPTPAQLEAATARLNTEQLMSNMRQMGIWLPTHLLGKTVPPPSKAPAKPTPAPPKAAATASVSTSAGASKKQKPLPPQPRGLAKRYY